MEPLVLARLVGFGLAGVGAFILTRGLFSDTDLTWGVFALLAGLGAAWGGYADEAGWLAQRLRATLTIVGIGIVLGAVVDGIVAAFD